MNYAVIKIQGHQEIVNPNSEIVVDLIEAKAGDKIVPEVLLVNEDGNIQVGAPKVDFPIELELSKHQRGEKIYVSKFHSKVRYRKRIGFRAEQSVLKVVKFGKEVEKAVKTVKTAVKKTVKAKSSLKTKKTESSKSVT